MAYTSPDINPMHIKTVRGRFAPSPTGRMHLGNIYAALMSWLSIRSKSGKWVLRIEDLDPQRSRMEYARMVEDDLLWLGLNFDEGGVDSIGSYGPYLQSQRGDLYNKAFDRLKQMGLLYPCFCSRADIMATQAPHQSDGRIVYYGKCRPTGMPQIVTIPSSGCSTRIFTDNKTIEFTDRFCGKVSVNLANHCGDFVIRRSDGAWAYMLAVVVDDALMGITEVVRGNDLLLSAAQQKYLFELLDFKVPEFAHIPLLCNNAGQRLSKRDKSLDIKSLKSRYSAKELIGKLAHLTGMIDSPDPCTPNDLLPIYDKYASALKQSTYTVPLWNI